MVWMVLSQYLVFLTNFDLTKTRLLVAGSGEGAAGTMSSLEGGKKQPWKQSKKQAKEMDKIRP